MIDCLRPLDRRTAWELIGFDGSCRTLPAGRTIWESVDYDDSRGGSMVKLSRLEVMPGMKLRQVTRYVHPDTPMEVLA